MLAIPWWFIPAFLDLVGFVIAWCVGRWPYPGAPAAGVACAIFTVLASLPIWALCYVAYASPIHSLFP